MAQIMEDFSTPMLSKRDRRSLSRCSNLRNPSTATAAIQAIARARSRKSVSIDHSNGSSNGAVQVKIVMSKEELKQMVASIGLQGKGSNSSNSGYRAALEQMLHVLRKKQMKRAESSKWQPALQSIPEEL